MAPVGKPEVTSEATEAPARPLSRDEIANLYGRCEALKTQARSAVVQNIYGSLANQLRELSMVVADGADSLSK
jgi:hypothetical protein